MSVLLHNLLGAMLLLPMCDILDNCFSPPHLFAHTHIQGGRTGMYGRMTAVAEWPLDALADNKTNGQLVGFGLTPEAIETNPIVRMVV